MRKYPLTRYPLTLELDLFSKIKESNSDYISNLKDDINDSLRDNDKVKLSNDIDKHDKKWMSLVLLLSSTLTNYASRIKTLQYDNYINQNVKAFSDNVQNQMLRLAQLANTKYAIDNKLSNEIILFNENLSKKLELSGLYTNQVLKEKILNAMSKNLNHSEIMNIIDDEVKKGLNNLAFNTRDKVSSLNSQILKDIHIDTGIEEFYWISMRDEKVRDKHAQLDNDEKYNYISPPMGILPGEEPNCRCVAYPVIDESVIQNLTDLY